MEKIQLERNLIFFNPGKPGPIFTIQSGNFVDSDLINQTADHLEYETERMVDWHIERRSKPRPA